MANNTSLSILRDTPLTSNIATEGWTSENFTFLSTTNDLSNKIVSNLSNVINTKLSTIADEVSAEVQRVDEISTSLSNYSLTSHTHPQYATRDDISAAINTLDSEVTGEAGVGKTLTSFSQTDGKVTAGFADIAITKSQVTDFPDIPEVDGKFVHLSGDKVSSDFALLAPDGKNALSGIAKTGHVALGYNSDSSGNQTVAIGDSAKATANSTVAVGYGAEATQFSSTAIGYIAKATNYSSTAIGRVSEASGLNAVAIGERVKATGSKAIAIGTNIYATAENSIQIGNYNTSPALSNNTANTLQIWDKPLLERTGGKIFFDRIPTGTTSTTVAVGDHTHNTADLINNAGFITSAQVDEKIDAARVKTMEYQGTVTTYADLPSSGNKQGDVWNVVSAYNENPPGTNYAWNGTTWDPLGGTIDVSVFATKAELNDLSAEVIDGLSNEVLPKLSTIGDLTIEQSQKINAISSTLSDMTPLSTTNAFSAEVFNEFSSVLYPDISTLKDLVSAEVEKIDAISATYISGVIVNNISKTVTNNIVDLGTVLTAHQSLSAYTPLSTTNEFSADVVNGLSNEVLPKLSTIGDLTIEQSQKINAISSDLSNYALTSQIPTVNDGTLIIQKNGILVQSFNANQSNSVTANISVPLSTSQLFNDSGFITEANVPLSDYTPLSTTNDLISTINDELSGNINPKISSIADEVSAETVKLDELSGSLSAYAKLSATELNIQDEYTEWVLSPSYISVDNPISPWPAMIGKRLKLVWLNAGYWQLCLEDGTPCGAYFGNLSSTELSWGGEGEWTGNFPVYAKRYKKGAVLGDQTSATLALENHSHALSDIANLPGVVQTGSYNDLLDKPTIPLSTSQLTNDSGYITSSYVSLSAVEKSNTLVLTEEQKTALVQESGIPAEAWGDFAISVRTSDGFGYIGNIDAFSAQQNANGDWVFVGGMPWLESALGWTPGSTVIQGSEIHTILSVDKVSVDIATKDELTGYLPLNGGGVVTGNVAIQNLDGDSLFSLNNYGKVTIGVGASIAPDAQNGVAIGANAYAAESGITINADRIHSISANDFGIAIGDSVVSGGSYSIQLGYVNNNSDALFRVWKYPMLDGNGDIPEARVSAIGYIKGADVPLSDYTPLSTTTTLSNEVVVEISSVINPKLSTIISLVSSEVDKLDEISGNLSNYVDLSSYQQIAGQKVFKDTLKLSCGPNYEEIWLNATPGDGTRIVFSSLDIANQTIGNSDNAGLYFQASGKSKNAQTYVFPGGVDQYDAEEQIIATERYAKQARNVLPILAMTSSTVNLSADTYVYRVTDTNNTGTFPTLVAPTDIVQTGDYYFTFEIEWTTAASVGSYSGGYDWITYPEFAGDGSTYTYYITGRWDSSGSGGSAFTLNCWRAKKLTA